MGNTCAGSCGYYSEGKHKHSSRQDDKYNFPSNGNSNKSELNELYRQHSLSQRHSLPQHQHKTRRADDKMGPAINIDRDRRSKGSKTPRSRHSKNISLSESYFAPDWGRQLTPRQDENGYVRRKNQINSLYFETSPNHKAELERVIKHELEKDKNKHKKSDNIFQRWRNKRERERHEKDRFYSSESKLNHPNNPNNPAQ